MNYFFAFYQERKNSNFWTILHSDINYIIPCLRTQNPGLSEMEGAEKSKILFIIIFCLEGEFQSSIKLVLFKFFFEPCPYSISMKISIFLLSIILLAGVHCQDEDQLTEIKNSIDLFVRTNIEDQQILQLFEGSVIDDIQFSEK